MVMEPKKSKRAYECRPTTHRRIRQPGQPQPATDGLLSFGVGEAAPAAADGGGADRVPLAVLGGLIGLDAAHDPPAGAKGGRGGDACDG